MKDSCAQSLIVTAEMIWHHKIMKYYEKYVDQFIAPSMFMKNICVRFGWDEKKFIHIPHPVLSGTARGVKKDGGYVAYVGRLSEEKGLMVLLDAAAQTPDIPYVFVGAGPLGVRIKDHIETRRIKNVSCVGFKTGDELHELISAARLLVLPSLWYENYPLSILEAKAMGNIVIGSEIGGIPEMLPRELLVESGNAEKLGKKIQEWYEKKPSERKKMGDMLKHEVTKENDPEKHVKAIEALYHSLRP